MSHKNVNTYLLVTKEIGFINYFIYFKFMDD